MQDWAGFGVADVESVEVRISGTCFLLQRTGMSGMTTVVLRSNMLSPDPSMEPNAP